MSGNMKKALAVMEVIVVVFVIIPLLTLGIYRLFPSFETWQTAQIGFPFPVFVYVVMVAAGWGIALLRKKTQEYGLSFEDIRYHLNIFGKCFFPAAMGSLPFAWGASERAWSGALQLAVFQIGLLFFLGYTLRKQPTFRALGPAVAAGLVMALPQALPFAAPGSIAARAVVTFLTFALFVGFGEEILYRGYMQSRLNEAFGKPFHFFGVAVGWGWIIASLLFGLTHVGILRWVLGLNTEVTLAWGFWTIFGGLVFGFVREKTGSILAPALQHGLPQALFSVILLFL